LIVQDREGRRSSLKGDTFVFAACMKPNNSLKLKLQGRVPTLHEVGDCVEPRKIIDAISEAARIARDI
jgi:hypothetical protein